MLIGLCGYGGAGKDTAAEGLTREGWTRVALADPLKDIATELGWDGQKDDVGRRFLQVLGQSVREHINPEAWIWAAEKLIDAAPGPVVVTDVRYPNEAEMIRRRGGFLVWIIRRDCGPANEHVSERPELLGAEVTLANRGIEAVRADLARVAVNHKM
jgi:hypothetical protein